MEIPNIVAFKDRRYKTISIDKIKVINPRIRDEEQFQMNVQSIDNNGMLMPIRVNDKFLEKTGLYELICGEGRLIAHQRLEKTEIEVEVVTCTRKEAYLQSLVENLARSRPGTMVFAREVKQLRDEGWNYERISKVCCRTPEYVRQYIGLVEKGEDRLIQGVEQHVFPISFAVMVAQSDDASIQNVLMDAFDQGVVNCQNFARARRIIGARLERANGDGEEESCWSDCRGAQEGHFGPHKSQAFVCPWSGIEGEPFPDAPHGGQYPLARRSLRETHLGRAGEGPP